MPWWALVACVLLAAVPVLGVTGCENLGKFNDDLVVRQAERYYETKYGEPAQVVEVWEDRTYALFAYESLDRAFCTMSDGATVLVDFEEGVLGDTRQQDEITAAYEQLFREAARDGEKRLENAGYTVALTLVDGVPLDEEGFLAQEISRYDWGGHEGEPEKTGSFFYARYDGDERFFAEEAPRVTLSASLTYEISRPDASFENAFPTDVPERPAWIDPIDETCRSLLPLTAGDPVTTASVYQAGHPQCASSGDEGCGLLGELNPYRAEKDEVGAWLVVEWVPVVEGVYVTSDEHGVRLRAEDVTLRGAKSPYSLDELRENESLRPDDSRSVSPAAFKAYHLETADGYFETLPESVREKGWFYGKLAYDNTDPGAGLKDLGITPAPLEPSLYTLEDNPAAASHEDEPPVEIGRMRKTTLENGFQHISVSFFADKPTLLVRM